MNRRATVFVFSVAPCWTVASVSVRCLDMRRSGFSIVRRAPSVKSS